MIVAIGSIIIIIIIILEDTATCYPFDLKA